MKKIFLILVSISFFHFSYAQETFEKIVKNFLHPDVMMQNPDSSFTGITQNKDVNNRYVVLNYDKSCNPMGSYTFPDFPNFKGKAIKRTADYGFIIVGNSQIPDSNHPIISIIRTDSFGKQIWRRTLDFASEAMDVIENEQSNFVVLGDKFYYHDYDRQAFVYELDANGDSVSFKQFFKEVKFDGNSGIEIFQTQDKGYLLELKTSYYTKDYSSYLIKTDKDFEIEWKNDFSGFSRVTEMRFLENPDATICVVFVNKYTNNYDVEYQLYFCRLNEKGTISAINYIDNAQFVSLCPTSDEDFIIGSRWSQYYSFSGDDIKLFKVDSSGNLLDYMIFGEDEVGDIFIDLTNTIDGCFLVNAIKMDGFQQIGSYFIKLTKDLEGEFILTLNKLNPQINFITQDSIRNKYLELAPVKHIINYKTIIYAYHNNPIGKLEFQQTSFKDSLHFDPIIQYHYRVRYSIGYDYSDYSDEEACPKLEISSSGTSSNWNLTWLPYVTKTKNIYQYNIYRGRSYKDAKFIKTVNPNINSFTDLSAPSGNITYFIEALIGYEDTLTEGKYYVSRSNAVQIVNNSVEENEYFEGPKIYPNPGNGMIQINNITNAQSIKIYTEDGKIINSYLNPKIVETIDLSNEDSGIYFIEIVFNQKTFLMKYVLE